MPSYLLSFGRKRKKQERRKTNIELFEIKDSRKEKYVVLKS